MKKPSTEIPPANASHRQSLPDMLKGLAVLLMIQIHLTELFAVESWFFSLGGSISLFLGGPPAAPVFMAVMGYFLAKGNKTTAALLRHGLTLIGWGLLLNLGMNAHLLIKYIGGTLDINPWTYVFGVDILFLAGLSVILIAVLRKLLKNKTLPLLFVMVLVASVNPYLPLYTGQLHWVKYLQAFFNGYYHWSYFPVFPWAAYPLAGYVFHQLMQKNPAASVSLQHTLLLALALLIGVAVSFRFGFSNSVLLQVYYHHSFLFFIWTLAFVLLWVIVIKLVLSDARGLLFDWIRWIGKNVTAFYIFQWLLIGNMATSLYKSQYPLALLFWFIIITAAVNVLVVGWSKLKAYIGWKN
jgi:uncharacterized membrane protein